MPAPMCRHNRQLTLCAECAPAAELEFRRSKRLVMQFQMDPDGFVSGASEKLEGFPRLMVAASKLTLSIASDTRPSVSHELGVVLTTTEDLDSYKRALPGSAQAQLGVQLVKVLLDKFPQVLVAAFGEQNVQYAMLEIAAEEGDLLGFLQGAMEPPAGRPPVDPSSN